MRRANLCLSLALAGALALAPATALPAAAADITLTREETEALKLQLIQAKPNVSTVTISSFLFPGTGQAYMGHVDRTLLMWGGYILAFTALKAAVPETMLTAGQKTSDVAIVSVFMGLCTLSALDAYFLARAERSKVDRLLDKLSEKSAAGPTGR